MGPNDIFKSMYQAILRPLLLGDLLLMLVMLLIINKFPNYLG
jgi:hypothetical protein